MLSELYDFTFQVLPWITYVVFSIGMILKIAEWLSGAGIEQANETKIGLLKVSKLSVLNLVFQRKMFKKKASSIAFWLTSLALFHLPIAFVLFGHLRALNVWSVEWFTALAPRDFLVNTLPTTLGLVAMIGVLFLMIRRVSSTASRSISVPSDYIFLLLMFAIITTGNLMRLSHHVAAPFITTIPPGLTITFEKTPSLEFLILHAFLVQLSVMYLPFSNFIHVISSVITTVIYAIRRVKLESR